MQKQNTTSRLSLKIAESAVMIALAFILSLIPIVKMPFGGDVTLFAMLPVILIAYRHGVLWGFLTGFAYSLLQLLTGLSNLEYATSALAAFAIVMLDYVVAFTVLGLGGLFRNRIKSQTLGLSLGVLLTCLLRFLCHFVSGCTVWAGVSIPSADGMVYSLAYNAAYMVPETVITLAGAILLSRIIDFRAPSVTRVSEPAQKSVSGTVTLSVGMLAALGAIVFDALHIFLTIQTEEGFDITRISQANWGLVGIVTGVGALVAVAMAFLNRKFSSR